MRLKWDAHLGFAKRRSARIRPLVVNWLRRSHPAPALNAVIVLLGALVMAAVPAVGTAHDGVPHWHCDPSEGNIRQVACTFEWGGGEQPDEGDLQVHGFLHAPNCQSLPARSPLRTGGLQVVRGSDPPPVGTGPGGNTFTYTANAQSAALDRCILAVASLRRGSGNYSLIQSSVFGVDFENGAGPVVDEREVDSRWRCDPEDGIVRKVTCTLDPGTVPRDELIVSGFRNNPSCLSPPRTSSSADGDLGVVAGSRPPAIPTDGGSTFTYTAHSGTTEQCIVAVAAVARNGGGYALVSSPVFAVDFENGAGPGDAEREVDSRWRCDPAEGTVRKVTCTLDPGTVPQGELIVSGFRNNPLCLSPPRTSSSADGDLGVVAGSRPPAIPTGPGGSTFTYTAHSGTAEQCIVAVAAVARRGGGYALVSSPVFAVDFENGAGPGDAEREVDSRWRCDPEDGIVRKVTCTLDPGTVPQGELIVSGFRNNPSCLSPPRTSSSADGDLGVVAGSRPPAIPTGPGGSTFTYTAHSGTAEQCIVAVAAVARSGGGYALVSSPVFAVDFENGQVPGAGAASGGPWHLPLLFACRLDGPSGFVRIVNLRNANNRLRIQAFDESGANCENAVNLGPNQALHFNSCDLDNGNRAKGLRGCGAGQGHWRLVVEPAGADASDPSFFVGAYARTGSGDSEWAFLTSMHDYAEGIPNAGDAAYPTLYAVPVFNPGRNVNQVSRLRVTNLGDASRSYILAAVDDAGDIRGVTIGPVARGGD